MKEDEDIVYLEHPVTPEEKAKYRKQGKKIIDIAFAPEGYAKPKAEKAKTETKPKEEVKQKAETDTKAE